MRTRTRTRGRTRGRRGGRGNQRITHNNKSLKLLKSNLRLLSQENTYLRIKLNECRETLSPNKPTSPLQRHSQSAVMWPDNSTYNTPTTPLQRHSSNQNDVDMLRNIEERKKQGDLNQMNEALGILNGSNQSK